MNESLATGRWKKDEVTVLMNSISQSKTVTEGCTKASRVLYRSSGSCYQKYIYEKNKLEEGNKLTDLLEDVQLMGNPPVVEEVKEEPKKGQQTSIVVPKGSTVTITIQIG